MQMWKCLRQMLMQLLTGMDSGTSNLKTVSSIASSVFILLMDLIKL